MTDPVAVYDSYYNKIIDGTFQFRIAHSEELDRMIRRAGVPVEAAGRALDFGCGDGSNAEYLCALGFHVEAMDPSENAVRAARNRLQGRSYDLQVLQAGEPVPGEPESFDLAIAWEVLHWLGTADEFLKYLRRFQQLLRSGGHLIFSVPTPRSYLVTEAKNIGDHRWICNLGRRDGMQLYAPSIDVLKEIARSVGFEVSRVMSYDYADESQDGGLDKPFSMYTLCLRKDG